MSKAGVNSQSRSSPKAAGAASVAVGTGGNPIAGKNTHLKRAASSETWPTELDACLKSILTSQPGSERQAISVIRRSHPELSEDLIWFRMVYLGLTTRKRPPYRKHEWTAEEDEILRSEYGRSRASSHQAIEKIFQLHPDWSRDSVVWRAHVLGLTQHRRALPERWSPTLDYYLLSLMRCPINEIARRLNRSKKSVLARLRRLGWGAEFFGGYKTKDLIRYLLVTENSVNRWVRLGWLERKKARITEDSLHWLCHHHPEEIPFETLDPVTQNWLRRSLDYRRGGGVQNARRKKSSD